MSAFSIKDCESRGVLPGNPLGLTGWAALALLFFVTLPIFWFWAKALFVIYHFVTDLFAG